MAVPKIVGIETEYGVALRGAPDPNPVVASQPADQRLRRAAPRRLGLRGRVARAATRAASPATARSRPRSRRTSSTRCSPTARATTSTTRTPSTPRPSAATRCEAVLFDKAGERILARSMDAARRLLPPGQEIVVYKNNSDGKGNSYGCHENYLVDRNVPFAMLVRNLIPWFVTRQVFTGAGKVGSENGADAVDYQISQRADFFEEEVGLETTLKRPIVNTRDEPHADPQKYRRLHVIVGDANLCEVATFLKVGTTAIVLAMIEDGFIDKDLSIASPVAAMRAVSHDPTLPRDGRRRRRSAAAPRSSCSGSSCGSRGSTPTRPASSACGGDEIGAQVLDRWEAVLGRARVRPVVARRPARLGHEARTCCARTSTATASSGTTRSSSCSSVQYHDVRPGRRCTRSWCARARSSAWSTRTTCTPRWPNRPSHDPGVFPGHVPRPLGRLGRRRELGQPRARRRNRPAAKDPDDGAHAW